jgi:hypothetical protein
MGWRQQLELWPKEEERQPEGFRETTMMCRAKALSEFGVVHAVAHHLFLAHQRTPMHINAHHFAVRAHQCTPFPVSCTPNAAHRPSSAHQPCTSNALHSRHPQMQGGRPTWSAPISTVSGPSSPDPPRWAAFESLSRLAMWAMLLAADDRFVTAYLQIACVRPGE